MYVHTGEMLGQPSPKPAGPRLPDWMRLYLREVDKRYQSFTYLFEILSLHPAPWSVKTLRPLADKIEFERGTPRFWWDELRSELGRIRHRRQQQDQDFRRLLVKHLELFQDVVKSFKTFKREDLEPFLIEALLASGRHPISPTNWAGPFLFSHGRHWNLGKRFVKEKLPQALSKRVTESPWYMQEVLNAHLANSLWVMANAYQFENAAFKKKVEMEEKARAKRAIEEAKSKQGERGTK